MRKKKVQQSEFQKQLNEKLENAAERQMEAMMPKKTETKTNKTRNANKAEKQREANRRYREKLKAQKAAEKSAEPTNEHLIAEPTTDTTSNQITPAEPLQPKKVLEVTITKEKELAEDYMYYRHECYRKDEEIMSMRSRIAYLESKIYSLLENAR